MMTIRKLVDKYIKCGKRHGFFHAETILLKYLPDDKPDGICADVDPARWEEFAKELDK